MKTNPKNLKDAISTLRAGDVITNLACCAHCAPGKILVLERNISGDTFVLSMAGEGITFIPDTNGPFRWNGKEKAFYDKRGRLNDRITLDCVVLESVGMDAVEHYKSIPTLAEVNYTISPDDLPAGMFDATKMEKIHVLLQSLAEADNREEHVGYTQLIIQMLFGDTTLNEQQMRGLMIAVNGIAQVRAAQVPPSFGAFESLFGALMSGVVGAQVFGMDEFLSGDHDGRRPGRSARERTHQH